MAVSSRGGALSSTILLTVGTGVKLLNLNTKGAKLGEGVDPMVGKADGISLLSLVMGVAVGSGVGELVGRNIGCKEGRKLGTNVGAKDGDVVRATVGAVEGALVSISGNGESEPSPSR